jgi:hypothetical protein
MLFLKKDIYKQEKRVYKIMTDKNCVGRSLTGKKPFGEIREFPPWAVSGNMSFSVCAPLRSWGESACGGSLDVALR